MKGHFTVDSNTIIVAQLAVSMRIWRKRLSMPNIDSDSEIQSDNHN
jgi:hypothetical protein